jgi:hypothetical protein
MKIIKNITNIFKKYRFILFIFFLSIGIGLYRLDDIPGEIWGDVIEHYYLTDSIMRGHFYFHFAFGGDGPLFSYFAALTSYFLGLSFYSLKISTVLMGSLLNISVYYYTNELFKKRNIAYISSIISAISFWTISFSRQAKPYILVPLFVSMVLYFLMKKKRILAGFILGLGMYSQASFWGMFLLSFLNIPTFIITLLLSSPLFISSFSTNSFLSSNSYIGEKLITNNQNVFQVIQILILNIKSNLLSFNFFGDSAFRHKIPGDPHLDIISGLFFLIGFAFLLYQLFIKKKIKYLLYLFLPFIIIQIPSILDIHNAQAQPNMARMIGIIPLVYAITAYGIYSIFNKIRIINKITGKITEISIISLIIFLIFAINIYKYFIIYPKTLPNGNTPFGKIIIEEINKISEDIPITFVGSSWGAWGQPEQKGIEIMMKNRNYLFIPDNNLNKSSICSSSSKFPNNSSYVFVVDPTKPNLLNYINDCYKLKYKLLLKKNNWDIVWILSVKK